MGKKNKKRALNQKVLNENVRALQNQKNVTDQAMKEVITDNQCNCNHKTNRGENAIVPKKINGENKYQCTQCGKIIDISNITPDEIKSAIHTLDRIIDIKKLTLDIDKNAGDREFYMKLCKFQKKLNRIPYKLLAMINKGNNPKKKPNNRQSVVDFRN